MTSTFYVVRLVSPSGHARLGAGADGSDKATDV